jgi:DNA-binding MarR family transcriptional regulator
VPKPIRPGYQRSSPLRRIFVSEDDVAAARKVLEVLTSEATPQPHEGNQTPTTDGPSRSVGTQKARQMLAFRQRRIEQLGLQAEPPFALLVALYVNEHWEPYLTSTRLTQLAWVGMSSTLRWIDKLLAEGLIEHSDDPEDLRKIKVSLSALGRAKLDALFQDHPEGGESEP